MMYLSISVDLATSLFVLLVYVYSYKTVYLHCFGNCVHVQIRNTVEHKKNTGKSNRGAQNRLPVAHMNSYLWRTAESYMWRTTLVAHKSCAPPVSPYPWRTQMCATSCHL